MKAFRKDRESPLELMPETNDEELLIDAILYVMRGGGWVRAIPIKETEQALQLSFDGDLSYLEWEHDDDIPT
jgi:hypothetical protein